MTNATKVEEVFTLVLNWYCMRNTDQKSSLQHLAAQQTLSPSFSANVRKQITEFKSHSIHTRQKD